ncbi:MAG TPA: hypothetical protein VMW76_03420 [Bacteroidales bacterium]|nr:hypothetical protein [Bacteroidales bacterium]
MRLSGLALLLILGTPNGMGQNLLGYDSDGIMKYIRKNHPDLVMESNFKNDHYKYLKFTDGPGESETILFFMSPKDRCTSIKAIYDLSRKNEVLKELDELYARKGENRWKDRKRGNNAVIMLQDEQWYVTVSIRHDKSDL